MERREGGRALDGVARRHREFLEARELEPPRPACELQDLELPNLDRIALRHLDPGPHSESARPARQAGGPGSEPGRFRKRGVERAGKSLETDRRGLRIVEIAQPEKLAASAERIVGATSEVELVFPVQRARDAREAAPVGGELDRVAAVAQKPWPLGCPAHARLAVRAGVADPAGADDLVVEDGEDERAQPGGEGVAHEGRTDRREERPGRGADLLGTAPDPVPFATAREIEGDQKRQPGGEPADPLGDAAGARGVAQEARGLLVDHVAAHEGEVDEGRHAQPHVVEPDEHPEPIVGQEAQEELEAPGAEFAGFEPERLNGGDDRPHEAVLVVPGGIGREAEEGVDDRGHPEAPAQHPDRLLDERQEPARGEELLERPQATLDEGGQEHEVDREERRRERPVDHARERFGIEERDSALDAAEILSTPFAEQRIDDVGLDRATVEREMDARVARPFVEHGRKLWSVEVPGERTAGDTAQDRAEHVEPPGLQPAPPAARHVDRVGQQVDPGISRDPGGRAEQEAVERVGRREIGAEPEADRKPDDRTARVTPGAARGVEEAAAESRAAVERLENRARRREEEGACESSGGERRRLDERPHRRAGREQGRDVNDEQEDEAVDGTLAEAVAEMAESGGPGRPADDQGVQEDPGHHEDLRPKRRLGEAAGDQHGQQAERRGQLGHRPARAEIGELRGDDRGRRRGEQERQEHRVAGPAMVHRVADADGDEEVEPGEHEEPRELDRGRGRAAGRQEEAAELAEERPGAEQEEQVEEERPHEPGEARRQMRRSALAPVGPKGRGEIEGDRSSGAERSQGQEIAPTSWGAPRLGHRVGGEYQEHHGAGVDHQPGRRDRHAARPRRRSERERARTPGGTRSPEAATVPRRRHGRDGERERRRKKAELGQAQPCGSAAIRGRPRAHAGSSCRMPRRTDRRSGRCSRHRTNASPARGKRVKPECPPFSSRMQPRRF
jgi:hypothetical protein